MAFDSSRLAGKVAIVTGSGQGIGKTIAQVFAAVGATVVVADLNESTGSAVVAEVEEAGGKAKYIQTDLRKEADIERVVNATVETFDSLDIIVNCARPNLKLLPFSESFSEWDLAMNVMVKAPALTIKYAVPHMLKHGRGSVINISSTNASFISHQPASYHVAKAAILQLTRWTAFEFGPTVRVNAICPGLVDLYDRGTPLTSNPTNRQVTELTVPLKRAALAEEIAEVAVFLGSESSAYITGQVITIDGGISLGDHFHIVRRALDSLELVDMDKDDQ